MLRRDFLVGAASLHSTSTYSKENIRPRSNGVEVIGSSLLRNGSSLKAIGCNFYSALHCRRYKIELKNLAALGVPFIRTNFGELWAGNTATTGWRQYLSDKQGWIGKRADFLAAAEDAGIGVVATMFWRLKSIPDLMAYKFGKRDTLDRWGKNNSNTRHFMREITAELADRFDRSPAIWGWEIGNEYKDVIDRPLLSERGEAGRNGGPQHYASTFDSSTSNGSSDMVTYKDLFDAFSDWNDVLQREALPTRLRSSGMALPSVNTYNAATGRSDGGRDFNKWMSIPPLYKPAPVFENSRPFNVISSHIYQHANIDGRWFESPHSKQKLGPVGLIELLAQIARRDGRPLFLGEFGSLKGEVGQNGAYGTDGSTAGERRYFTHMLNALVHSQVTLSAVWNYGYFPNGISDIWNIDIGSIRDYQLLSLSDANSRLNSL
ncbi:MAG: hypothetical protein PSY12_07095 [bacterium]|nr:hypothetical protein [bacterium]